MDYFDQEENKKYIPYVIEPSLGADRAALAFLCDAYDEEEISEGDVRVVLHLHPALAPYKAAMMPVLSASVTVVRMKSVRRSASPTISTLKTTAASLSATATRWSRFGFRLPN